MNKMKILLEAYLERNFGDDLFVALLTMHYKHHVFYLLDNASRGCAVTDCEGIDIHSITEENAHSRLDEFDAYVLVGGDFYPPYSNYAGRMRRAEAIKGKGGIVIILGASLYREYPEDQLDIVSGFLGLADLVTFRDSVSYRQCIQFMPDVRAFLSCDMAFTLDSKYEKKQKPWGEYRDLGISVRRKYGGTEKEFEVYCELIAEVMRAHLKADADNTVSLLALSTSDSDDRDTADRIKTMLPQDLGRRVRMIDYSRDVFRFIEQVDTCDAIVSTRFHALCMALILGKPFFPISYEVKIENLLKDLGYSGKMADYGAYFDPAELLDSIAENHVDSEKYREYVKKADDFFALSDILLDGNNGARGIQDICNIWKETNGVLYRVMRERNQCRQNLIACQSEVEEYRKSLNEIRQSNEEKDEKLRANQEYIHRCEERLRESEEQKKQLQSLQSSLGQLKAEAVALEYWLDVAGRSAPLRLAHFFIQLKHSLLGSSEEKAECRRWLKGDRSFVPKFSYVRQSAVRAAELNAKICALAGNAQSNPAEQSHGGLNGYEYKYLRFLNKRNKHFQLDFTRFAVSQIKYMVSVILPVYNGDDMIEESIRSVLDQTYRNFELIIVDDGSTDKTPRIVDHWARKDKRIRVVHQANAKLPRALNKGFSLARGEFLTWTSADNRMHRNFLEKLVDYMQRKPDLAMCYANLRAIDAKGEPMKDNAWYPRGEQTGNVYLPNAVLRLNTYPENTVAAAFMYRRAVPNLLGGYDPQLYTVEDYDYWMRINDFCSLRHTDFEDAIYDYRFHDKSLTSKAKELRINEMRDKLMLMEDYRQDWIIRPMCWLIEQVDAPCWHEMAQAAGDISMSRSKAKNYAWPKLGTGVVQVRFAQNGEAAKVEERLTQDAIRVLVRKGDVCEEDKKNFDFLVQLGEALENVPEGWIRAVDEQVAFDLIAVYCKAHWFDQMIETNRTDKAAGRKATIVLCTYKRTDIAKQALAAMSAQNMSKDDYEILVVNNDPESDEMRNAITELQHQSKAKEFYRYIDCPYPGLSAARNFSLYEANGEILLYVDDDGIMDCGCLAHIIRAFEEHEDAGVVGGQILLKEPERFKNVILEGYEGVWSERKFSQKAFFEAEHDWNFPYGCNYAVRRHVLRELGGFRVSYGRVGKDFAGGEEIVLSHLVRKAGMKVGIEPRAIVTHDVDPDRYSMEHVRKTIRASRLTNRLMKMDLYKPYDLGMHEEYQILSVVQSRMQQLRNAGVCENDLRFVYCQNELDAVKEAIEAGEEDMRVMNEYTKQE